MAKLDSHPFGFAQNDSGNRKIRLRNIKEGEKAGRLQYFIDEMVKKMIDALHIERSPRTAGQIDRN